MNKPSKTASREKGLAFGEQLSIVSRGLEKQNPS
jgi:hypothetical protein